MSIFSLEREKVGGKIKELVIFYMIVKELLFEK